MASVSYESHVYTIQNLIRVTRDCTDQLQDQSEKFNILKTTEILISGNREK